MNSVLPISASLVSGLLAGASLVYLPRNRYLAAYPTQKWLQRLSVVLEWLPPALLAIIVAIFDLWKPSTWKAELDATVYAAFFFAAGCISFTGVFKWFLAAAKERQGEKIETLERSLTEIQRQCRELERQRDFLVGVQVQTSQIVGAKLDRLATARDAVRLERSLLPVAAALAPRVQINLLMKMLHSHFQRDLANGHRLRAGVYALAEPGGQVLEAVASWDGERDNCFSNNHQKYMRLTNPAGTRSLVVECYLFGPPLHRIKNCRDAMMETPPRFTFFSPEQQNKIRSMVAYRYPLRRAEDPSALVLTLDTDQADFFSDKREFECLILFQEAGQRIELELVSLELLKPDTDEKETMS